MEETGRNKEEEIINGDKKEGKVHKRNEKETVLDSYVKRPLTISS
jgi:hypothetical protein